MERPSRFAVHAFAASRGDGAMASRVIMINEGRMVYDGPVTELGNTSEELEAAFHELTRGEASAS